MAYANKKCRKRSNFAMRSWKKLNKSIEKEEKFCYSVKVFSQKFLNQKLILKKSKIRKKAKEKEC